MRAPFQLRGLLAVILVAVPAAVGAASCGPSTATPAGSASGPVNGSGTIAAPSESPPVEETPPVTQPTAEAQPPPPTGKPAQPPGAEPTATPGPKPDVVAGTDACQSDADCVPAQCCHPTSCAAKSKAPACKDVMCTRECRGGTMDCGGGCLCQQGRCAARLMR